MLLKPKLVLKILLSLFIVVIFITGIDIIRIIRYKTYPKLPNNEIMTYENQIYWDLVNGIADIEWENLDGSLKYIKSEYDCSDFRLVNIIRILYDFEDRIPTTYNNKIKNVLFNFRYWLDEPGENSMCYWSENHQILFASAEFLIGQKYPNTVFINSGLTGQQHSMKSKTRILDWLEMRWNYGFTEFYSNVYYEENIAALINLIDYAEDEEIVEKSKIIMDLLFYDVATQSTNNMFVSVSGRAYEANRKGGIRSTLGGLTNYYWGDGKEISSGMMYGLMVSKNYKLPSIHKEIAQDNSNIIIKQSNGLNISELESEGLIGKNTKSLMMQWGMEAFVNPTVVRNSLSYIRAYRMFSNEFLSDFKQLDFTLLRFLYLEPLIVKVLDPQSQGKAIERGNTYTYKTKNYSLYTVQNYHSGNYSDQHHVFGMNINNFFSIFHNHPAADLDYETHSPNYWVGYGNLPHSVQNKNVNLSIYNIPSKKRLMNKDILDYTHAYFPKEKFDTTLLVNNYLFGKKDETYCVLIGTNNFQYVKNSKEDIIQHGKQVYWITEAGSKAEDGSFKDFIRRIQNNKIQFDSNNLELEYHSNNNIYNLKYDAEFKVNDVVTHTEYDRFDSPYINAKMKDEVFLIKLNNKTLYLDFENMIRESYE